MVLSAWLAAPAPAPPPAAVETAPEAGAIASAPRQPTILPPDLSALPFAAAGADDRARSLDCLAAAIHYEAANEPGQGRQAVAEVVLNRVRRAGYPKTVCGVVFQGSERRTGCQFTFTCDGALRRRPSAAAWTVARAIAEAVLDGRTGGAVGEATNYHADYVRPYWSPSLVRITQIGAHIFYRPHERGAPPPGQSLVQTRDLAVALGPRAASPQPAVPGAFQPWGLSLLGPPSGEAQHAW
jgi:spore germination cell wall hydrolase CwlJ-like protein